MKPYYEQWNQDEINDYINKNKILILFNINTYTKDVSIVVCGKSLEECHKNDLKYQISAKFGNFAITSGICKDINEFSKKWYHMCVPNKKTRLINKTGKVNGR